jgi:hypothetical protein
LVFGAADEPLMLPGPYDLGPYTARAGYAANPGAPYDAENWSGYTSKSVTVSGDAVAEAEAWGMIIIGSAIVGAAPRSPRGKSRDGSAKS